jgi:hypothetical protein
VGKRNRTTGPPAAAGEARKVSNGIKRDHRSNSSAQRRQEHHQRHGAALATLEAVMFSLRERGESGLASLDTQRRLSELSADQLCEVIERLDRMRDRYPAVTDSLLVRLGEKLP